MSWLAPLVEAVVQYWGRTGKAYNLAKAKPELLQRHVSVDVHLAGRKLKDAIQEDAATELRLIRNPEHRLSWGLVPYSVDLPTDLTELFAPAQEATQTKEDAVRFSRGVWLAFSKPLKLGTRRFLELREPSAVLHEVYDGQPLPPSGVEVLPEYIWSPNGELIPNEDRDQEIEQSIRRWAKEKGISVSQLVRREISSELPDGGRPASFIDISGLSQTDKARILIPLDLLEKIRFGR